METIYIRAGFHGRKIDSDLLIFIYELTLVVLFSSKLQTACGGEWVHKCVLFLFIISYLSSVISVDESH